MSHHQGWTPNQNIACGKNVLSRHQHRRRHRPHKHANTPSASCLKQNKSPLCRRAIRAAFKNQQRGAILTTHYMEEAEAVCDRVAIMVSGQLRWVSPPPGSSWRASDPDVHALFSIHQVHRHHPAFEREIRSGLQFGGEAARGADGAAADGAAAQRDPANLPSRLAAGEVRPS